MYLSSAIFVACNGSASEYFHHNFSTFNFVTPKIAMTVMIVIPCFKYRMKNDFVSLGFSNNYTGQTT